MAHPRISVEPTPAGRFGLYRPASLGSVIALLPLLVAGLAQATTVNFSASGTWTAPAGVTQVTVEAWGGGGAGGGATTNPGHGGGGAGGQYANKLQTVVPGNIYTITVGAGGTGSTGAGTAGGDSIFGTNLVVAKGGAGGTGAASGVAGAGSSANGVGDVVNAGGSGSAGAILGAACDVGGAGGGGAGSTGAGRRASGNTAGSGTNNGGGNGGTGITTSGNGTAGSVAGGGGGGACAASASTQTGGNGGAGKVTVTYATLATVTTNTANGVGQFGATLRGTVSSNGGSTVVTFDYGLTTSYGSSITATQSPLALDASGSSVSATLTNLSCSTLYHFRAKGVNNAGTANGTDQSFTTSTCQPPTVLSISRNSVGIARANQSVSWTVTFSTGVTGVDASDFALIQSGGVVGASITSVSGSGSSWTVTATTGTSSTGSLGLNLIDNDSIMAWGFPLGGSGAGNGNFTGESYTLLASVCTGAASIIFCDDFERSSPGGVGNGWTVTPANPGNCTGTTGNAGCAGIDSDIPPFNVYANPRANASRAMFTRWSTVSVDSPVINLGGKAGAQLSFWMRRGSDAFSEYPEAAGENYLVQYLASDNTWKILAQYPSGVLQGEVFQPVIELPPDALHAGFKMRFYQPSGSGSNGTNGGAPGVIGYDYWHMDDVVVKESTGPSFVGAFCDNFEAGLSRWSITAEGAPNGSNIGDASIGSLAFQSSSHELDLRWGYVSAATFKTNMTGVSGNITYWVRTGTTTALDPVTNENLVVEYLNSSGSWVTLATYLGTLAAGSAATSATHVLPSDAKHASFRLRFRQLAGSGYDKSYWHVDDVCVGNQLPTADLALTKTGGTVVPGSNVDYTLRVTNNGPDALSGSMQIVDTLPFGLTFLGNSGAGWSCGANVQVVTCNWSGSLTNGAVSDLVLTVAVGAGVTGSVTNTATVSGSVNDPNTANNTGSVTSGNFVPAYVFTDKACLTGLAFGNAGQACNVVNWSGQTAGQSKTNIFITAVNTSGVPTQLSASSATTVGFQFGLTCHNPVAHAGVQATFSAAAAALPLCAGNGAEPTTWSATSNLSFAATSASVATNYSFAYADVGEIELYMRNAASTSQKGTSGKFVSRPAGFVLSEIKPTANPSGRCAVATAPAPAVSCAGAATDAATFVNAGEAFSVTVTAVTSSGAATPNFGKETTAEFVKLVASNVLSGMVTPVPVVTGSFGAFTAGVASGTAFGWSEVGIITLTPQMSDADYLGTGNVVGTTSGNVGRFIPDHFDTAVITQGCNAGGFTYSGQPFSTQVTARNLGGATTVNYSGPAGTNLARNTTLSNAGSTSNFTNNGPSNLVFTAGIGVNANVTYTFPTAETTPATLTLRAHDTDGVTSGTTEGTALIRSGRLRLQNAYGSELLNLPLPLRLEYFNGTAWIQNTSDTCTPVAASNFAFSFPVAAGNNLSACETALSITGSAPNYLLSLRKPGTGNNGWTDLTMNLGSAALGANSQCTAVGGAGTADVPANLSWLKYDWTGTGASNPSARATFGIFKSPLIYRRENY